MDGYDIFQVRLSFLFFFSAQQNPNPNKWVLKFGEQICFGTHHFFFFLSTSFSAAVLAKMLWWGGALATQALAIRIGIFENQRYLYFNFVLTDWRI